MKYLSLILFMSLASCVSGPVEYCSQHAGEYPDEQSCYAEYRQREAVANQRMWEYNQQQQQYYQQQSLQNQQEQQRMFNSFKQVDFTCMSDCQKKYLYQFCQKQCEY